MSGHSAKTTPERKPQRLLFVIGSLDRGGAETHLSLVLPKLDKTRFQAEIFTLMRTGELAKDLTGTGVKVIRPWISSDRIANIKLIKLLRWAVTALQLWLYMLWHRPALVHFFLPASYIVGAPIALLARRRPLLMSRRSLNEYQKGKPALLRNIEIWLHQRMDAVLGNSRPVVQQLIQEEHAPADRSLLLYNGIQVPDIDLESRAKQREILGLEDHCVAMMIVANLIAYKGHADLLEACSHMKAISKTGQNWRLFIIGNDSQKIQGQLEDQARELGIAEHICFLGPRRDVPQLLPAADIGILASHEEGFSNAILEMMAAGLPTVVTNVGGNSEAVLDGETGFVVPPRDPNAMAKALETLLNTPNQRVAMGREGRTRIETTFTLDRCVKRYETLYNGILAGLAPAELIQDKDGPEIGARALRDQA